MFTVLPKNPEGRPPAVIDLLTVERAASIGCTVEDIAALLGLSRKTIYNHMEQDPELAEAMDRGRGMGRASLRRMQWEKAEVGDTSMLIWLGKVLCGQKDTSAVVLTGPNNGPVQSQSVSATVEIPANDPIEAARVYQKLMSGDG
jgi:predicted DNA-binding transcriptional regulator AlpA